MSLIPLRLLMSVSLTACLALVGCTGADGDDSGPDSGPDSGLDSGPPAECADVAPESCDATSGCVAISGYPILDDGAGGLCTDYDSLTPLGCMSSDGGCAGVLTIASDPADPETLWYLTSGCMPEGWTFVESTEYPSCS